MLFKASAPGSLMLLGEYAVLAGKTAIVAAIDQTVQVTIQSRQDQQIQIKSVLGTYHTNVKNIEIASPFEYVLTALTLQKKLNKGCDILIDGNCMSGIGLGSSAAVTIATLAASTLWLENKLPSTENLWHVGKQVIDRVQGKGSGADLAASIYGGVITFRNNPLTVEKIAETLPLSVVYCGEKLKTAKAIDIVNQRRQQYPQFFAMIDDAIEQLSLQGIKAIKTKAWKELGLLFDIAQGLMVTLGVSNELLDLLLGELKKVGIESHAPTTIYGAKISGAGLGDCIIGVGYLPKNTFPLNDQQKKLGVKQIDLIISNQGVHAHAE